MSVTGRLWRRAPLWRTALITAVACTALAAMFPPDLSLSLPPGLARLLPGRPPTPLASGQPSFSPQPAAEALDYSTIESPLLGPGRSGIIPFAGRQFLLPAGDWQELVLARSGETAPQQFSMLDRVENGKVTGLMVVGALGEVGSAPGPVAMPAPCFAADTISREITHPTLGGNPMAHECWTLTAVPLTGEAARKSLNEIMVRGLDRLDKLGTRAPDEMLQLRYIRSDETGWFNASIFVPDTRATSPKTIGRLEEWIRRYVPKLGRGFDNHLLPTDITPAATRDPE